MLYLGWISGKKLTTRTINDKQTCDLGPSQLAFALLGLCTARAWVELSNSFALCTVASDLWSVAEGASCNVPEIFMNIHCSGTHTESVGHLLEKSGDIGKILTQPFLSVILIE